MTEQNLLFIIMLIVPKILDYLSYFSFDLSLMTRNPSIAQKDEFDEKLALTAKRTKVKLKQTKGSLYIQKSYLKRFGASCYNPNWKLNIYFTCVLQFKLSYDS